MEAYNNFRVEFAHLEMLHASTLFAYDETIQHTTQRAVEGYVNKEEPVFRLLAGGNEYKLASDLKALHNKYKTSYRTILRETIFVRAISVLEVFLIDTVREMLLSRKDFFFKADIIPLSCSQLISFKNSSEILSYIINNECRNLHSGGFKEIIKYFRNRLKIELNNFKEPLKLIFKYHDERHLIVHRLGLTDKEYRHKYNTDIKRVSINEKYLISAFKEIRIFCDFVLNESKIIINSTTSLPSQADESFANIVLKIYDKKGVEAVKKNYIFSFDEDIVQLKDLGLHIIKEADDVLKLIISGDINYLKRYIAILEKLALNKSVEIIKIELTKAQSSAKIAGKTPKKTEVSAELLARIRELLPPQPWEKGIHKIIANTLGLPTKTVRIVISKLISDGVFKNQVDGRLIE